MLYLCKMHLKLLLHNIRSTYNVGAILRTAEGLGASEVIYSGYTPRYNDSRLLPHLREKLDAQIAKSALGAEKLVTQEATGEGEQAALDWITTQKSAGWTVIGLENNLRGEEQAKRVVMHGKHTETKLGRTERAVLVLGEEVDGIPRELREKMDFFLEIPMRGKKESFNVSVAAGIAMWWLMDE